MFKGNDRTFPLIARDQDNAIYDLSNCALTFHMARDAGEDALIEKTIGNGIVVIDPTAGTYTVTLLDTDTDGENIDATFDYYYDVVARDAADKYLTVTYGRLRIRARVE